MQEAIFSLVPSSAGLAELIQLARTYVEAGRSVATRRAESQRLAGLRGLVRSKESPGSPRDS